MPRFVEIEGAEGLPSPLTVRVGDVLVFRATGGRVRAGKRAVEFWGPFLPAVVGTHGEVLAPESAPNTVLLRACRPGSATVDIVTGDPWRSPRTHTVTLLVVDL